MSGNIFLFLSRLRKKSVEVLQVAIKDGREWPSSNAPSDGRGLSGGGGPEGSGLQAAGHPHANSEKFVSLLGCKQGWEFAHLISARIARFLSKNERMSDSLKKMSNSLIRSFLVSDLSDSLTIAHFL